jgi:hypothetical protein
MKDSCELNEKAKLNIPFEYRELEHLRQPPSSSTRTPHGPSSYALNGKFKLTGMETTEHPQYPFNGLISHMYRYDGTKIRSGIGRWNDLGFHIKNRNWEYGQKEGKSNFPFVVTMANFNKSTPECPDNPLRIQVWGYIGHNGEEYVWKPIGYQPVIANLQKPKAMVSAAKWQAFIAIQENPSKWTKGKRFDESTSMYPYLRGVFDIPGLEMSHSITVKEWESNNAKRTKQIPFRDLPSPMIKMLINNEPLPIKHEYDREIFLTLIEKFEADTFCDIEESAIKCHMDLPGDSTLECHMDFPSTSKDHVKITNDLSARIRNSGLVINQGESGYEKMISYNVGNNYIIEAKFAITKND